jgi:hypothetical protein
MRLRGLLQIILLLLMYLTSSAQVTENGEIQGRVYNAKNNEPIPFAAILILGTNTGTVSDAEGKFQFTGLKPGYVELKATTLGYKPYTSESFLVTNARKAFIEIALDESQVTLNEVTVKTSPFTKRIESPVSLRRIGVQEIERTPGANRDISRVIQSFPGVLSTPAYRNDIIVRGGGASENRFYLDGIEIPNINHFATQGASGGPVGIINVDFVREVNFYSGAFPANRGNALSSVLEFNQVDGNKDKLKFRTSVGASDMALAVDGPLGSKTTFVASVRRSYLQFLFAGLGLPFLPTYNDFQFKIHTHLDSKNELSFVGLGAYDQNKLNLKANKTESQRYILGYLPENDQWSYTLGAIYKHYHQNGYDTWAVSRNHLNNIQLKYRNNIETDSLKILDYNSFESENKLRYERTTTMAAGYKLNVGANFEYAQYHNRTFQQTYTGIPINYNSDLSFLKWGLFGQLSKSYFDDRLALSLGIRTDANNYSSAMNNLLDQLSPRFSASYALTPQWSVNGNIGRYYQLPPYTTLGYRNQSGDLVNKQNKVTYIASNHVVTGIDYLPNQTSKLSVEGFYKWYDNYPMSVNDSISIASKGADFGSFGDEAVISTAKGRAYGMEVFYQSKDMMGMNVILSYTLYRSKADNYQGVFIPTAWDSKNILTITALKSFKRNWDAGFKWRFVGGAPYTPWDLNKSSLASAWDAQGRPYRDYTQFNQGRLHAFLQLDIRIDKEYFYKTWSLRFYLDVQNVYGFKSDSPDQIVRIEDANGVPLPATGSPARYQLKSITNQSGTVLPTIGVIAEF